MSRLVLYVFINKSLGMSAGKIGAQSVQAAIGAYLKSNKKLAEDWWKLGGHHTTLIMQAKDGQTLSNIQDYLIARGINSYMMIDEGMTEIDAHQLTALGVEIVDKEDPHTDATLSSFELYRDRVKVTFEIDK